MNTVTISIPKGYNLITDEQKNQIAQLASEIAIQQFTIKQEKAEILKVPQIAKEMKVSEPTVRAWMRKGYKGIILKHTTVGVLTLQTTRYDLSEFQRRKQELS